MADVNIKIKNLPQIKRAFGLAPVLMTTELNKAIAKSVFKIHGRSVKNAPVDTGLLRASHTTHFKPFYGETWAVVDYAYFVHEGTKYMKARPFMSDAMSESEEDVDRYFTQAVDKVLNKIGRMT